MKCILREIEEGLYIVIQGKDDLAQGIVHYTNLREFATEFERDELPEDIAYGSAALELKGTHYSTDIDGYLDHYLEILEV